MVLFHKFRTVFNMKYFNREMNKLLVDYVEYYKANYSPKITNAMEELKVEIVKYSSLYSCDKTGFLLD